MIFTSGSTGQPKAVTLSQYNLLSHRTAENTALWLRDLLAQMAAEEAAP